MARGIPNGYQCSVALCGGVGVPIGTAFACPKIAEEDGRRAGFLSPDDRGVIASYGTAVVARDYIPASERSVNPSDAVVVGRLASVMILHERT